jgi:hypothetical protein
MEVQERLKNRGGTLEEVQSWILRENEQGSNWAIINSSVSWGGATLLMSTWGNMFTCKLWLLLKYCTEG